MITGRQLQVARIAKQCASHLVLRAPSSRSTRLPNKHSRFLFSVISAFIMTLSMLIGILQSTAYAADNMQSATSAPLETILLDDRTLVVKDMLVVYPDFTGGRSNAKTTTLNPSFEVTLPCYKSGAKSIQVASCTVETYNITLVDGFGLGDIALYYKVTPGSSNAQTEISTSKYEQIASLVDGELANYNTCTTNARLVVAGNSWASGGNSWASGGNSWASGGNSWASGSTGATMNYTEAYAAQWSLDMIEKSANIYGTGSGHQVAFIDVFDHASANLAGLSIIKDTNILYAETPPKSADLTLHGNVVHSIFKSIAPDASNAIGIPVFNSAGYAINASVVRGVELAIEKLPTNSVINMSFGVDTAAIDGCTHLALESLFEEAKNKGITLVASSGNESERDEAEPLIRPMQYPADSTHVQGVAAAGPDYELADYSNAGEIMAPGGDGDDGIIVLVPFAMSSGSEDRYAEAQGTSFAAPYVSATIANLLSDGVSPAEIPAKLEQITESNCGIVSLNPFYAQECLAEYQELTRADYGVQRLPRPQNGPNPASWNTEPYWIGAPPCGPSYQHVAAEDCYVDDAPLPAPYMYLMGKRTIDGVEYESAEEAFNAYELAGPQAKPELFGIQLVEQMTLNETVTTSAMWLGVPDVCDRFSIGITFNALACASIEVFPLPTAIQTDFYHDGSRPVKPEMIIADYAYQHCAGFDGKIFGNASQAACVYRRTRDVMQPLAPTQDEGSTQRPILVMAATSPDDAMLPTIFVPLVVQ